MNHMVHWSFLYDDLRNLLKIIPFQGGLNEALTDSINLLLGE